MRVAAVQFKPRKGRKHESLRQLALLAEHAAADSDLVVLPEMAVSGYLFRDTAEVASVAEVPDGDTFRALAPVAARARAWMVVGFPERAADRFFNSALVIDPAGQLRFTYRKTLLYQADESWASPGDSGYRKFETDRGSFTLGICMDLNDDRFVEWCSRANATAIAFPTNWIDQGEPVWPYWAMRLWAVRSALVAANTYGAEGRVRFSGSSAVLEQGMLLAAAPSAGDAIIRAVLCDD